MQCSCFGADLVLECARIFRHRFLSRAAQKTVRRLVMIMGPGLLIYGETCFYTSMVREIPKACYLHPGSDTCILTLSPQKQKPLTLNSDPYVSHVILYRIVYPKLQVQPGNSMMCLCLDLDFTFSAPDFQSQQFRNWKP